eukprot:scaffold154682_cov17-Tisochrysis_lutea.AAC.1
MGEGGGGGGEGGSGEGGGGNGEGGGGDIGMAASVEGNGPAKPLESVHNCTSPPEGIHTAFFHSVLKQQYGRAPSLQGLEQSAINGLLILEFQMEEWSRCKCVHLTTCANCIGKPSCVYKDEAPFVHGLEQSIVKAKKASTKNTANNHDQSTSTHSNWDT